MYVRGVRHGTNESNVYVYEFRGIVILVSWEFLLLYWSDRGSGGSWIPRHGH